MENIFVEFLPPWVETGLQPAFYDKESGSVLQQTARMYARVNMLIRMFNKLSKNTKEEVERFEGVVNDEIEQFEHDVNETVDEYIEKFTALKDFVDDYFENLDVQEEINNKLDDMLEAGTLQEIITQYIQSTALWMFDTVADMKLATNLVNGSYTCTLGFYTKDDKGGATYKIRTKTGADTINEMTLLSVYDNTLVAELVSESEMNVKQFGTKGDGVNDDTTYLSTVFSYCNTKNVKKIYFPAGTYLTSGTINISSINIEGAGIGNSIIKSALTATTSTNYYVFNATSVNGLTVKNITIEGSKPTDDFSQTGDRLYFGLFLYNSSNVLIENCEFKNIYTTSLAIRNTSNVTVKDCTFDNNGWNDIGGTLSTSNIKILNNNFKNIVSRGINFEDGAMDQLVNKIIIKNNIMNSNVTSDISRAMSFSNASLSGSGYRYQNIEICNNIVQGCFDGINYKFAKNILISGNNFYCGRCINAEASNMTDYNTNITIINNIFDAGRTSSNTRHSISLDKTEHLHIINNKCINNTARAITAYRCNDVLINDNETSDGTNGILIEGNNVSASNNTIKNMSNYGITLAGQNIDIINNKIQNIDSRGIEIRGATTKYLRIMNNYIFNATEYGIFFANNAGGNKFALLRNNHFGEDRETPVFTYGYATVADVDYVVIEDTYLLTSGITLRGSSHWGVNCTFRDNDGFGTLPA